VVWAGGRTLSRERRAAFERWAALRQLEASGDLALTSQAARPLVHRLLPAPTARLVAGLTVAYLVGLVVTGFVIAAAGVSWRLVASAFGIITVLASVAAAGIGRAGPGRELQVQHNALLQQLSDTGASLLTVRGIAEFPAFDAYSARLAVKDAVLTIATDAARTEQVIDEDGYPIVDGVFGLGARQAFAIEAVTEVQPLAISWTGRTATIANRSNFSLNGCRFGEGFSTTAAGDLGPGESVTAEQVTEMAGPVFTCMLRGSVIDFTAINRPVATTGITAVALYRPTANADTVHRHDD
jgi:hypothetical protein